MAVANAYKTTFLHEHEQCRGTWTDKISRIYGKSYLTTGTLHIRREVYTSRCRYAFWFNAFRAYQGLWKTSLFIIISMILIFFVQFAKLVIIEEIIRRNLDLLLGAQWNSNLYLHQTRTIIWRVVERRRGNREPKHWKKIYDRWVSREISRSSHRVEMR